MVFAGLWECFRWPDGSVARTSTIVTIKADAMMVQLHDMMPVILETLDCPMWLNEVKDDPGTLLRPVDDDLLRDCPVSKLVNRPRNNGADLLAAVG